MSGDMVFRVNKTWRNADNPSQLLNALFAEVMSYFDDHPGMSFVSYGEGAVEGGTSAPTAWLAWDRTGAPPWSDNAWFVVNADFGSATLNGDGSRQWQLKFQVTQASAYADPSGVDYGQNGLTSVMIARFSPDGGWVGGATRDFSAVVASHDLLFAYDPGYNEDWNLHCVGDNETVLFYCQLKTGLVAPDYRYGRVALFGQQTRRNSAHTKPEYAMGGYFRDSTEADAYPICSRLNQARYQFGWNSNNGNTFSLAANGEAVAEHLHAGLYESDNKFSVGTDPDPWSGEVEQMGCLYRQFDGRHQSILGQLRMVSLCGNGIAEGNLTGDGEYLVVSYQTTLYGGVAIPWPGSGTIPLF